MTASIAPADVAERVLELIGSRAGGAAEAEVTVTTGTSALTRFADSFIHQNVAEDVSHVAVRIALDGRVAATSYDGPPTDEALARVVDNVLEAARVRPVDPDWPGVGGPADTPDAAHWDEATAGAAPDDRATRVAAFVAAGDGLETAGSCETRAEVVAFASSAGARSVGRTTFAELDGIARVPTADGRAIDASSRLADVDGRTTGDRAAAKARTAADPTDLEPGRYEVVLEPPCVADLLTFLFFYGFNARFVEQGQSFARVGEPQLDRAVSIREDVRHPLQVGVGFDAEGTPRLPFDVVRDGVTASLIHTRRTAAKARTRSTGNAVEGGDTAGALPITPVLAPGSHARDELIGSVRRGLLVTDLWYTRVLDPRTQVVTGLTRNGVWLVEDGRIVRPVRNLRFTQSYVEALAPGAVLGVGSDAALVRGGFGGVFVVPSLHLASWNFTGGAKG